MVHTRPIILHLALMLITKVVTSPLVRFQSLFGQEKIPIRMIKYVNEFCTFFVKSKDSSFMWFVTKVVIPLFMFICFLGRCGSFVRWLIPSFVRSFAYSFLPSFLPAFLLFVKQLIDDF